jgi:hypothetical protein
LIALMGVPMIGTEISTGIKRSPKMISCFDLTTSYFTSTTNYKTILN